MKIRNIVSRFYAKTGAVAGVALVSVPAFAQETGTYADITSAADWSEATGAIGTVAGSAALIAVAIVGARKVLGFLGRR